MALPFLIPLLVTLGLGAIGGAIDAHQKGRAARAQSESLRRKRQELEKYIDEVWRNREGVQRGLEGQASHIIGRARNTIGAGLGVGPGAGPVLTSGLAERRYQDALSQVLSALAQDIAADEQKRASIVAQIRQDPAFDAPDIPGSHIGDVLLGLLGGAATGAGSFLGQLSGRDWSRVGPGSWDWLTGMDSGSGMLSLDDIFGASRRGR